VNFNPKDQNFEARVRTSFARQTAMATLGIEIAALKAGEVELRMPYSAAYAQQHGFIHAGIITTALDTACGYAAFSLMPDDAAVLTIEFKTNLIAPARGASLADLQLGGSVTRSRRQVAADRNVAEGIENVPGAVPPRTSCATLGERQLA
jgi:uncharacterized protein (TIGR00369 family)